MRLVFSSEAGRRVDGPEPGRVEKKDSSTLDIAWDPDRDRRRFHSRHGSWCSLFQPPTFSVPRRTPPFSRDRKKRLSRIVMMHVVKKRIVASCRCPLPVSARQRAITYCARYKPCYGQGRWRVFLCPSALPAMRGGIWSKWTGSRLPVSVPAQEGRRYCTHPRGTVAFRFICRTEASLPSRGCSLTLTRLARPASQPNVVVFMSCSGREREACQIPPQS